MRPTQAPFYYGYVCLTNSVGLRYVNLPPIVSPDERHLVLGELRVVVGRTTVVPAAALS